MASSAELASARGYVVTLVAIDRRQDVGRGAEAVEADALGVAGHAVRAMTDEAGAEEWRRRPVVVGGRNAEAIARVSDHHLLVAAIVGTAGEAGVVAEV